MTVTRTFTQTHRHYRDSTYNAVDIDQARVLGYPLVAECHRIWIPGTEEETADLPICRDCERLNAPKKKQTPEGRVSGTPRTPISIRQAFPHYVYRCYDAQDQLLYVGCTYNPPVRMKQHKAEGKKWIPKTVRVRFTVFPDRRKALDMERLAIETEGPLHNLKFNREATA